MSPYMKLLISSTTCITFDKLLSTRKDWIPVKSFLLTEVKCLSHLRRNLKYFVTIPQKRLNRISK